MRIAAVIALALVTAGCFYSDEELITRRLAGEPLEAGYFVHAPVDPENGVEWAGATWEGEIRRGRRMRYYSRADNFPHNNARFRSMGANVWLAQVPALLLRRLTMVVLQSDVDDNDNRRFGKSILEGNFRFPPASPI